MAIFQNIFVKAIAVPVILAVAAALLEATSALVRGKSKGQYKYRVWIRQQQPDNTSTIVPLLGQSLQSLPKLRNLVEVEQMVNFDIADFGSLGIDLIIGAFAVDVASLIDVRSNPTVSGYVLIAHLLMLIGIVMFIMLSQLATPEELTAKRTRVAVAIGLGLLAMMTAFFVA